MKNRITAGDDVDYIGVVTDEAKAARACDATFALPRFVFQDIVADICVKPLELVDAFPIAEDTSRYHGI